MADIPFVNKRIYDVEGLETAAEIVVYTYLCAVRSADGMAWPAYETVADACKLSYSAVSRIIPTLADRGIICYAGTTRRTGHRAGRAINRWYIPALDELNRAREAGVIAPTGNTEPRVPAKTKAEKDASKAKRAAMRARIKYSVPEPEPEPQPPYTNMMMEGYLDAEDEAYCQDDNQPAPNPKPKPKPKPKPEAEIPAELLAVDGFAAAWAKWEKHRRERGNKLTPTTSAAQLEKAVLMLSEGVDVVAVVARSTEQGYTGLFWDNAKPQATQTKPQTQAITQPTQSDFMRQYVRAVDARFRAEVLEEAPKGGKVLVAIDDEDLPF